MSDIDAIISSDSMEGQILVPQLARALYKELGEPTAQDFPMAFAHATCWSRMPGWTRTLRIINEGHMRQQPVDYRIERPSDTKNKIIHDYYGDGWNVRVTAYHVTCDIYIQHPRHPQVVAHFIVNRDIAHYEYCIKRA